MTTKESPSYILHIGFGKTGTTSIQAFLAKNRDALNTHGILYPDIIFKGQKAGVENHNILGRALSGKLSWFNMTAKDHFDCYEKQFHANPELKTILLSAEALAGGIQSWDFENEDDYWHAMHDRMQVLTEPLKDKPVKIIIYLRRQDLWAESVINQHIKNEGLSNYKKIREAHEYIDLLHPRLCYDKILDLWARYFGKDNITAIPFEEDKLFKGDVVADFMHYIGIDDLSGFLPLKTKDRQNRRLLRDVFEFKRTLNTKQKSKAEEEFITDVLQSISDDMRSIGHIDYPLLTHEQRQNILTKYAQNNRIVAREYCGIEDGDLFSDTVNTGGQDYPGLSEDIEQDIHRQYLKKRRSISGIRKRYGYILRRYLRQNMQWLYAILKTIKRKVRP